MRLRAYANTMPLLALLASFSIFALPATPAAASRRGQDDAAATPQLVSASAARADVTRGQRAQPEPLLHCHASSRLLISPAEATPAPATARGQATRHDS